MIRQSPANTVWCALPRSNWQLPFKQSAWVMYPACCRRAVSTSDCAVIISSCVSGIVLAPSGGGALANKVGIVDFGFFFG